MLQILGFCLTGVWLALAPASTAAEPIFSDQAAAAGLDFVHFNGMSGELYYVETMGSGVALLDYDADGDLDVYLVQGSMLGPGKTPADALMPPDTEGPVRDRLFRNDLRLDAAGKPELHFTDVTAESGIDARGYGMGVAAADYDNDGDVDLYVTNWGENRLYRNDGEGRFSDVTAVAGVGDSRWAVSAAFLDYDADGWLDLYVGNYVAFTLDDHRPCFSATSARDYCGNRAYPPVPDVLYRNRGDGRFEDVTAAAGIGSETSAALGVATADFDLDGRTDIYVASDGLPNLLWINQGDGSFRNDALLAGCAVNKDGASEASMGVDVADFDEDGDEDIFITHLLRESSTLYINQGQGWFIDDTAPSQLGMPSLSYTSFGSAWLDFDGDTRLDLLVVNGEVRGTTLPMEPGDPYPLHQPNQLFRGLGGGRFEDVSARAGPALALSEVSRGAAFGDIDNDGDSDVVVSNNSGPVRLLRNEIGNRRPWIGLRVLDRSGRRDAAGARVELLRSDGRTLWRRARSAGSYASANDPRVLVGLGDGGSVESIRVHWTDGSVESWRDLPTGRYSTLQQGRGKAVSD